ncbi:GTPase family protein [Planctomicrobium sp. SH527]|uniref:GTPase family protein n=1 Tax=Planctomicrobium sp. SH527 TaxID=3448123 RepID=UPI003F5C0192
MPYTLSRRTITLAALIILPLLVYLGLGAYALWMTGLFAWTFWILPVFWVLTWIIAMVWVPEKSVSIADQLTSPQFTDRDTNAAAIVRKYQDQVNSCNPEQLADPQFYLQQAMLLSRDLAAHYYPKAADPIEALTVPEVLAAARLAIDDMEQWILESVPGSRIFTIRQLKWLQHAPKWAKRIQDTTWAASVLVNPANVMKYFTSKLTVSPITQELQTEFLAAIYLRFIRQTGFYLIEMNSGRLRGGAELYRKTFGTAEQQAFTLNATNAPALKPESLTVAVIGQVKAGKSSLINALIGKQVAKSDVLPETRNVTRYQLAVPETDVTLTLLDTPGYADAGATRDQIKEAKQALRESDMLILVMAANSPARDSDRQVMNELQAWYQRHPELQKPPIIICMTHIDLLSPMMEWEPPYDWKNPTRKKEHSIQDAVAHVQGLFKDVTDDVIPVCSDVERGRTAQILEELLPALVGSLTEGQMAAVLRTFHRNLDKDRLRTVFNQLQRSGKMLLQTWIDERLLKTFSKQ